VLTLHHAHANDASIVPRQDSLAFPRTQSPHTYASIIRSREKAAVVRSERKHQSTVAGERGDLLPRVHPPDLDRGIPDRADQHPSMHRECPYGTPRAEGSHARGGLIELPQLDSAVI
jgi:hypothetical protein